MKYEESIKEMINGKKAKLADWKGYLYEDEKGRIVHKEGKMALLAKDYLRDDWEIVEEKKSLSDKSVGVTVGDATKYYETDVKEAIKEFIERIDNYHDNRFEAHKKIAEELFGERLV